MSNRVRNGSAPTPNIWAWRNNNEHIMVTEKSGIARDIKDDSI